MRRLQRRLDQLQGDAHATMSVARELLHDLHDGVTIKLVNTGQGTVLDFLSGKIKELPIQIIVDPQE